MQLLKRMVRNFMAFSGIFFKMNLDISSGPADFFVFSDLTVDSRKLYDIKDW